MEAHLTGADRGASIRLFFEGSDRSGEPASISRLVVETTQREIDGLPAGVWVERLFRALCAALVPTSATAGSLGEGMSGTRRGVPATVEWLTYLGKDAATGVDRDRLREVPGVDVTEVGGGLLLRLDPSAGPRRTASYWERVRAVEATIGRPRATSALRQTVPRTAAAPAGAGPPLPFVPQPTVTLTERGAKHFHGSRYERTRFAQLGLREPGATLEGFELVRCEFDNVSIGSYGSGEEPVLVRDCSLTRCRARVALFGLVVVEDCLIDGFSGGFWATASVLLRHVVMRGPIDALDLRSPRQIQSNRQDLPNVHADHYRTVDWALDIREARFKRCDIGGVPGRLVRRDPATQILITRERALASPWREATAGHFWWVGIERLLESGDESEVFVACPRGDRFEEELGVIARLREAGTALPD
jgi:hypothetical protein